MNGKYQNCSLCYCMTISPVFQFVRKWKWLADSSGRTYWNQVGTNLSWRLKSWIGSSMYLSKVSRGKGALAPRLADMWWKGREAILAILADLYFVKYIIQHKDYARAIELSPLDFKVKPNSHCPHMFRRACLTAEQCGDKGREAILVILADLYFGKYIAKLKITPTP